MTTSRHAIVLAGGLGSRLHEVTGDRIPKALVPVLGKPFLFFKLRQLEQLGVTDVWVLTGHHGEQVDDFLREFDDTRLRIRTRRDGPRPLGTAGAIKAVDDELPEHFWITYGDSLVAANLELAEQQMRVAGTSGLMVVLRNEGRWQPSNVSVEGALVTKYEKTSNDPLLTHIDFGLILIKRETLQLIESDQPCDLAGLFQALVARRQMALWLTEERFHDVGTPDALKETEEWLSSGAF